ncbi:MAG: hypothetical protein ABI577_16125 [bacterium]
MRYVISPSTLPPIRTISRRAALTRSDIAESATRLRSWALIAGEQLTGLPFLRISGENHCEVHIPVAGKVRPHPETGVSLEIGDGGAAVTVRTVPLEQVSDVLRELSGEIAVDCGLAGPVEFHPASAEFLQGTLVWPVHKPMRPTATIRHPQLVEVGA